MSCWLSHKYRISPSLSISTTFHDMMPWDPATTEGHPDKEHQSCTLFARKRRHICAAVCPCYLDAVVYCSWVTVMLHCPQHANIAGPVLVETKSAALLSWNQCRRFGKNDMQPASCDKAPVAIVFRVQPFLTHINSLEKHQLFVLTVVWPWAVASVYFLKTQSKHICHIVFYSWKKSYFLNKN